MAPRWELVRVGALPGDDGQLLLVDGEDGPDGRTVCVVPGHLVHRARDGEFVRLLDEQDLENAWLFAAAPALRETLAALLAWRARTGGCGDPCWDTARRFLDQLRCRARPGSAP